MEPVTTTTPIGDYEIDIESNPDGTLTWMVEGVKAGDWIENINAGEALALATALMLCVRGLNEKKLGDSITSSLRKTRSARHIALRDALRAARKAAKAELVSHQPSVWKIVKALEELVVKDMDSGKKESSPTS